MSDRIRCACPRCTIRGLMGPAIVITIGLLFLLDQMRGGYFSFGNTFPVILIVIGLVSLASALASMEGHLGNSYPPVPPTGIPGAPQNTPQTPPPGQGQGQ
jgi:ABC-type Fe3+ transport system permease subunit